METLKSKIERQLVRKGVSARKMCIDTGISEQTLYNIYKKDNASYTTLKAISEYLDLSLMEYNDKPKFNDTQINDSVLVEFLKKENSMLKDFLREKLAVNFNLGGFQMAVLGM